MGNGFFQRRKKLLLPLLIGILLVAAIGITIPLVLSMNEDSSTTVSTTSTSTMSASTLSTDAPTEPTTSAFSPSTTPVSHRANGTLMIVGGSDFNMTKQHANQIVDIIDLWKEDSHCQSSEYPLPAYNIQAGVVLDSSERYQAIFCGGIDESGELIRNCYEYLSVSQEFVETTILNSEAGIAYSGSTVQIHNGSFEQFLWITGGVEEYSGSQKGVQLVSANGNVLEGPEMPANMSRHCAVAISDKAVLVVGGYVSNINYSNKTNIYDFKSKTWNPGPEITNGREYHACATFEKDEKSIVYVVGGFNESVINLDSVEFAAFDHFLQPWNDGMLGNSQFYTFVRLKPTFPPT